MSFLGGIFAYKRAETLEKIDSLGILLEQKDNGTEIKIKPGDEVRLKLQIMLRHLAPTTRIRHDKLWYLQ